MQQLNCSSEEQQAIVSAYDHAEDVDLPLKPNSPERPITDDEMDRVRRYMEVKSMSVAFESDVEVVLVETGISFQRNFRMDPYICDFLVDLEGHRVAIDCKYNVNRDWDRTSASVKLLLEKLPCDEVVIAVPYENELARNSRNEIERAGGRIVSLEKLKEALT